MDGNCVHVCYKTNASMCMCLEHVDSIQYVCINDKQEKTRKPSGVSFMMEMAELCFLNAHQESAER